jgi:hypothetical protein
VIIGCRFRTSTAVHYRLIADLLFANSAVERVQAPARQHASSAALRFIKTSIYQTFRGMATHAPHRRGPRRRVEAARSSADAMKLRPPRCRRAALLAPAIVFAQAPFDMSRERAPPPVARHRRATA